MKMYPLLLSLIITAIVMAALVVITMVTQPFGNWLSTLYVVSCMSLGTCISGNILISAILSHNASE